MVDITNKFSGFISPVISHHMVPVHEQLSKEMNKRDIDIKFLPKNENISKRYLDEIGEGNVLDDYPNHTPATDFEALMEKYDITNLRRLLFPELVNERNISPSRFDFKKHRSSMFSDIAKKFHKCLDFLDQIEKDLIPLRAQGNMVEIFALQAVATKKELPSICIGQSPVDNAEGLYHDGNIEWVSNAKKTFSTFSDKEIEQAEAFVESFRQNSELNYRNAKGLDKKEKWELILNRYELDSILKAGIEKGVAELKRRMNGVVSQTVSLDKAESRNAIQENNYVLFTIQNYTEERVLGHAFPYFDQAWLIEYLSKIVPTGHELYVKDHPGSFGLQPVSSIKSISKHAKLLHKEFPSHEAIKQASAVVTLNNTVGFESLLYGKDVVCLGNAFYSGAGYTRDVKNINELPRVLHQATSSEGLTDQEVVEFANALLKGSYQGEFTLAGIRDFTDSILRYIDDNELIEN